MPQFRSQKYPFQVTDDDRFGKGSLAISQKLMCSGNETTVWECENDVPSQRSFCPNNVRTEIKTPDVRLWIRTPLGVELVLEIQRGII